jgi:hypothetical protein
MIIFGFNNDTILFYIKLYYRALTIALIAAEQNLLAASKLCGLRGVSVIEWGKIGKINNIIK